MKLKTKIQDKDVRVKIMNALSRREHSEKEIYLKFISLVESKNTLSEEISKLKEEGLLSDLQKHILDRDITLDLAL